MQQNEHQDAAKSTLIAWRRRTGRNKLTDDSAESGTNLNLFLASDAARKLIRVRRDTVSTSRFASQTKPELILGEIPFAILICDREQPCRRQLCIASSGSSRRHYILKLRSLNLDGV